MSLRIPAYDGLAGEENPLGRLQAPSHWRRSRIKNFFRESDLRRGDKQLPLLSLTRLRGLILHSDATAKAASAEDHSKYKVCHPGWLVMNRMQAWSGMFSAATLSGIVSPDYSVFELTDPDECVEFFESLFKSPRYVDQFAALSKGIGSGFNRLYTPDFGSIPVFVPPPDEQAQIVRFIRHLDQRVNRLIKTKRRLIDLLNEQKQAIIHRAVTRGLDPTVPLKPSGIEWLGEVPSHWNLKRFKFVTQIVSGQVDPRISPFREMVLVAPNHIEKATGSLIGRETADEQGADSGKYLVKRGQVIYSKIRPNLQKATIAQEDCLCSADMYPIQPRPSELSPDYLLMLMLSKPFTQYVVDCSMRVAMPKVNRDALGNGWLWYPDLDSQSQILEFIASEGAPFDEAIARSRSEIDFIREYRTRLVADVVTGQLDVRQHPWANTDIEDSTEAITDGAELEDDLEETEDVLEEAGV